MSDNHEKGSALLLYVTFIFGTMLLLGTIFLQMTANGQLRSLNSLHQKQADQLATSGMETFMQYLFHIPNNIDRVQYFKDYPAWGTHSIPQPTDAVVAYDLYPYSAPYHPGDSPVNPVDISPGSYDVRIKVTSGQNNYQKAKELIYRFSVESGLGGGGSGTDVVDETTTPLLSPSTPTSPTDGGMIIGSNYPGGTTAYQNDFTNLIPSVFDFEFTNISGSELLTNLTQIVQTAAPVDPNNVITIACHCQDLTISDIANITAQKIVLYIDNPDPAQTTSVTIDKGTLEMSGMLLVKGSLSVKNNGTLSADDIFTYSTYLQNGAQANVTVSGYMGAIDKTGSTQDPTIGAQTNTYIYPHLGSGSAWDPSRQQ